jgi:5S rRNA maturation endonuclease (ribonuclease M5)
VSKIAEDLAKAVRDVTKGWKTEKRHADRHDRVSYHSLARMRIGRVKPITREVAFDVMEEAYNHASTNGRYYANARQIMYAARPLMLAKEPSLSLDGKFSIYFTQVILKDYLEEHSPGWKVVWDARGHLIEPYTGRVIGLGGIEVTKYIESWTAKFEEQPGINIEKRIRTAGPVNRFSSALFIEKEGFTEILKDAGIQQRYDIALMSTKGLPVKAACDLANALADKGVTIYVLHDFDLAGFKIVKTLREGTRMASGTDVEDIGLRFEDIGELESESVEYRQQADPKDYLEECGATPEEREFLVEDEHGGGWIGQRVEINAMTSDELIDWLEEKFEEHEVKKVIPDKKTLTSAYYRAKYLRGIEAEIQKLKKANKSGKAPSNLREKIEEMIGEDSEISWDDAIWECTTKKER